MKNTLKFFAALIAIVLFFGILATADKPEEKNGCEKLAAAALERTHHLVVYDGSYRKIDYPMGDVPANIGVCTDVVIRSYRTLGIDLQKLVHEDMSKHFSKYPQNWGLKAPDSNIDHRRVPNLARFFERNGEVLPVSKKGSDYHTGEIVTWMLSSNVPHIGIVAAKRLENPDRPYVIHNIGMGPRQEDVLFSYKITGHYSYPPCDSRE